MKKCPNCTRNFDDDNDYCPEDGTLLVSDVAGQPFGNLKSSGEMPTQVVARPQTTNPQLIGHTQHTRSVSTTSQYFFFGVILVFAMVAVGFAVAYFSSQNEGDNTQVNAGNAPKNQSGEELKELEAENERLRKEQVSLNSQTTAAVPGPESPSSPAGKWSGDWRSTSGAHLTADVVLVIRESQRVEGEVVWVLRRTVDPSKQSKIGLSATEFVRGTFDPVARKISFAGFRKDDPYGVLANLDKYRLTLSSDGNQMTGTSSNFGRWNAHFNLTRR
jgi:hypothetical protein